MLTEARTSSSRCAVDSAQEAQTARIDFAHCLQAGYACGAEEAAQVQVEGAEEAALHTSFHDIIIQNPAIRLATILSLSPGNSTSEE